MNHVIKEVDRMTTDDNSVSSSKIGRHLRRRNVVVSTSTIRRYRKKLG